MSQLILETLIVIMRFLIAEGDKQLRSTEALILAAQIAKCEAALAEWGKRDG